MTCQLIAYSWGLFEHLFNPPVICHSILERSQHRERVGLIITPHMELSLWFWEVDRGSLMFLLDYHWKPLYLWSIFYRNTFYRLVKCSLLCSGSEFTLYLACMLLHDSVECVHWADGVFLFLAFRLWRAGSRSSNLSINYRATDSNLLPTS